jgi:hypothetical protein
VEITGSNPVGVANPPFFVILSLSKAGVRIPSGIYSDLRYLDSHVAEFILSEANVLLRMTFDITPPILDIRQPPVYNCNQVQEI